MRSLLLSLVLVWAFGAYAGDQADQMRFEVGSAYLEVSHQLSLARNGGFTCETDAYQTSILQELTKAQNLLGAQFSGEYKKLPAIEQALQTNIMLRMLLNRWTAQDLQAVASLVSILPQSHFYSVEGGALGAAQILQFQNNLVVRSLRREGVDSHGQLIEKESFGKWRVEKAVGKNGEAYLVVIVDLDGQRAIYKIAVNLNEFELNEISPAGARQFVSTPPDCEA